MKILGISRSPRFSPNSIDRDAAIFAAVSSRMQRGRNDVSIISEDLFVAVDLSEFDLVYSMARGRDVLEMLAEGERTLSLRVANSAQSLLQATRSHLVQDFVKHQIPQPSVQLLQTNEAEPCMLQFPLWLKRGDACAQQVGDVRYLSNSSELPVALQEYAKQGVRQVIAMEHVEGDLVKFYGVEGTDFFYYTYPTAEKGFSKFGLEQHNGTPVGINFDISALKEVADRAAQATGLIVYGGDAVVRVDGTFQLIDFNDWPSFSPCRKEAAKAIAQRLIQQ